MNKIFILLLSVGCFGLSVTYTHKTIHNFRYTFGSNLIGVLIHQVKLSEQL